MAGGNPGQVFSGSALDVGTATVEGNLTVGGTLTLEGEVVSGIIATVNGTTNQITSTSSGGGSIATLAVSPTLVLPGTLKLGGTEDVAGFNVINSAQVSGGVGWNLALAAVGTVTAETIGWQQAAQTATITGSFATQRFALFARPTISAATALTVTTAATVAIANSPATAGVGPAAITNAYALWVQAGMTELDGGLTVTGGALSYSGALATITPTQTSGQVGLTVNPAAVGTVTAETIGFQQAAQTLTITGGFATQRFANFAAPAINAATSLTVTTAATVNIAGAPTVGGAGPAIITNPWALRVASGSIGALGTTVASANYGTVSLGDGPWDGTTSGFFTGSSNGTALAINAASGFTGRLIDAQVAGIALLRLNPLASGNRVLNLTGATPTVSSVTAETGGFANSGLVLSVHTGYATQRFALFAGGTITADQAGQTVTNAASVAISGSPGTSAAGGFTPTVTNAYALWVQGGMTELDGGLTMTGALGVITPTQTSGQTGLNINPAAVGTVTAETIGLQQAAQTLTITGGYASQRFAAFAKPTISAGSALTVTTAATVAIADAPAVASSAVITNSAALWLQSGVATPAGGVVQAGVLFGSAPALGIYFGSGAPTLTAKQGSLYLRTDGAIGTRAYINSSSGSGSTWTGVTTAG